MCGRYTLYHPPEQLQSLFGAPFPSLTSHYNIAPTQSVPFVFLDAHEECNAGIAKWGLVPHWVKHPKDFKANLFNARAETASEKPAFRDAFKRGRCLIPSSGFYEWKRTEGGKTPHFIRFADDEPFAFAGLFDVWRDEQAGERLVSCTILTTDPNPLMAELHERMPVIVHLDDYDLWLSREITRQEDLEDILKPFPDSAMEAYPVSARVNSPRVDEAALIARSSPS